MRQQEDGIPDGHCSGAIRAVALQSYQALAGCSTCAGKAVRSCMHLEQHMILGLG